MATRFQALADQWKSDCAFVSSTSALVAHAAYQSIITLGHPVVPLILRDLERESAHWFGVPGKKYLAIGAVTFSPDSQHLAYVAQRRLPDHRLDLVVVRDGVEGKGYANFPFHVPGSGLFFSPDSRHLAYVAQEAFQNHRIVVDDQESKSFHDAPLLPLVFNGSNTLHTLAGSRRVEISVVNP